MADELSPLLTTEAAHKHDHEHEEEHSTENAADMMKLQLACVLTLIFFGIELAGGYISGSLALFSDAAHMLSDSTGLIISVLALWIARRPASEEMTFGFARAEVLAAFVSVLFIWTMTAVLVLEAISRLLEPEEVDGKLMAIVGFFGLIFNISRGVVLGHSHSHGYGEPDCCDHDHGDHTPTETGNSGFITRLITRITGADIENPAVRAAFLCVITDSMQNVGVIIAGLLIIQKPSWTFLDPCVTFVFSVVVILATKDLAKQTTDILMEGTPRGISVAEIRQKLLAIASVVRVNQLRTWGITLKRKAATVHLIKDNSASDEQVFKQAQHILKHDFNIATTTVQIEAEDSV